MKKTVRTLCEDDVIPNNPDLPVLIYQEVIEGEEPNAEAFERLFKSNGWGGMWRDGIFDYHHFHSNAHEVLGIAQGEGLVRLGGESGLDHEVKAGDALLLPAGTGHKLIRASRDFLVVGAYPKGQEKYDICCHKDDVVNVYERLRAVALPDIDPVDGRGGFMLDEWPHRNSAA